MAEYSTYMQTAAAAFSAVAAVAAAYVAARAFAFQKNVLFKKVTCEQVLKVLNQIHYLKSVACHAVLDAPDEDIIGVEERIANIRESVVALESMVSPSARGDVQKLRDIVNGLREAHIFAKDQTEPNSALRVQLDHAIKALNRIYKAELK